MTTLVISLFGTKMIDIVDEKSKQLVESKQIYNQGYGQNAPGSPSNSMHSVLNFPSRPATSHHMSPEHAFPTGMANMDKSETMPEIQMPSMACLDPLLSEQDQTCMSSCLSLLI